MSGRPRKNKQIAVNYKTHQELETEAIENNKTIKEVAEERIYNDNEEEINSLQNRIERLEDKCEHFKKDRNQCEKEKKKLEQKVEKLKKQSSGKWEGYEEISREELEEGMKEMISGVGEKKASKFFNALNDKIKIVAPKED